MNGIYSILTKKPYLAWYIKNKKRLSKESVVEHILNYGDWDDYLKLENVLGIKKMKEVFKKLKGRKRSNLRPKTINFFTKYYQKYAR